MEAAGGLTPGLMQVLGDVFDQLSLACPRLYTVPLLPWAGWSAGTEGGQGVGGGKCGRNMRVASPRL